MLILLNSICLDLYGLFCDCYNYDCHCMIYSSCFYTISCGWSEIKALASDEI